MNNFFQTDTGKKTEKALWEMLVLLLGILIVYSSEANIVWLLPYVGIMNQISKWINQTYIK